MSAAIIHSYERATGERVEFRFRPGRPGRIEVLIDGDRQPSAGIVRDPDEAVQFVTAWQRDDRRIEAAQHGRAS